MTSGIYLIWDLPLADGVEPEDFFAALGDDLPCAVQLRAKGCVGEPVVLDALTQACERRQIPLFINDQRAWLRASHAGIHLGQDDGPSCGFDGFAVSRSTHDLDQVRLALLDPTISSLGFGPVRSTHNKVGALPARGLASLAAAVVAAQPKPVIAIGGIRQADLGAIRRCGAHSAAVIGAVWQAPHPAHALRQLVCAWAAA